MQFSGKAFKYGDNVDTDVIIPARYLTSSDTANLRAHAMEDIDPSFASSVCTGDIIVAGENFGSGSSREHAPLALKASGINMVIAKSFARIFFRNSINIGLMLVENDQIVDSVDSGDIINFCDNKLINKTKNITYILPELDSYIQNILDNGGLINSLISEEK